MMEPSSLEVKVISCRHLKAFNFFQKLSVYAAVSIFRDVSKSGEQQRRRLQTQKTPVHRDGGSRPEWNHTLLFDVRDIDLSPDHRDHLFLRFELRSEGLVYGKNCIGEVRVPFMDLVDEFGGTVRFLSYQVRSSDGKPNGVLNFSYKFAGKAREITPNDGSGSESRVGDRKVQFPSVDDVVKTPVRVNRICYPSLDDVQSSCTGLISNIPAPRYGGAWENYAMTPPRPLPHTAARDAIYHLYHNHLPVLQSPGPYKYVVEESGTVVHQGDAAWKLRVGAHGEDMSAGLYAAGR